MNQHNLKVFVFATTLAVAPALAVAQNQGSTTSGTQPGTTQQGTGQPGTTPQGTAPQAPPAQQTPPAQQAPATPPDTTTPPQGTPPEGTPPAAPAAPATPVDPAAVGLQITPPTGWQQGDPTAFQVPGQVCCAWSPDNVSSIVVFVQNTGAPLNPRVLLDQSAEALKSGVSATIDTGEVRDVAGMRALWLVATAPGNGAAIDGKGTVPTTQHWVGIPREKDVIILLMTTPADKFATHEPVFQEMLNNLRVTGAQTPDQQASK